MREILPLPAFSPGTQRSLLVHRFGPSGGKKAYLQASLHADELPGILVVHHLLRLLKDATFLGEVVVVPYANPIGLSQSIGGNLYGRSELHSFENFNRRYADLAIEVGDEVAPKLGMDADENCRIIREALRTCIARRQPRSELDALRHHLLTMAIDADIVLDLHCDFDACMHLYVGTPLWPDASDLASELGAVVTLTAEVSGGEPFDEAAGGPWWALAKRFLDRPIPPACLSATVELRGENDVDDVLAEADARALFRFLQRRGLIAGDPGPLQGDPGVALPFEGVEMLRAPTSGLLVWKTPVGVQVKAGEVIGELVDPNADPGAERIVIRSESGGILYGRVRGRLVRPGQIVGKVAGFSSIRKGYLLTD